LLRVRRDADEAAIDAAYNELFDQYEPQAHEGDQEAVAMLEDLNEARDTLMDPRRRAALDARLGGPRRSATGTEVSERPRRGTPDGSYNGRGRANSYGRRPAASGRPRAVEPVRTFPVVPVVIGLVAVAAVIITAAILIRQGVSGPPLSMGEVVATVNGEPIYRSEYDERVRKDRENALSDPFFAAMANNFEGITGTRMLDVLQYDALDKLVNLEVIVLQAKKENLFPSEQQQNDLVEQAKANDLQGRSFEDFLREKGITEEQYRRSVVRNVVYAVMASKYMPQQGSNDERTNAFISWICTTRESYDVKINLTFQVENNKPCSSGLPSDVPLTDALPGGEEQPIVPEPEPTGEAPLGPVNTPTPAAP
jgi:curved DNA-binding protein CbpA